MARQSEYNFEMCKEICERVSNGEHIKSVLDSKEEYPDFTTWCRWKRENQELYNLYIMSIQDKAEMVIFEIDEVLKQVKEGLIKHDVGRLIIDTLKWKAAKFYPKMFGDNKGLDITSNGDTIVINPIRLID